MGQVLERMCYQPQQSKGELPCEFAVTGNVEGIKALCRMEGCAFLEWTDVEGRTPLIAACTSPHGIEVAKALIKLGANVNAYSPGGTPLHHAAKEGLEQTIELLLSHGATASLRNYDGQTPLDVAEMQGFTNLVRLLESEEDVELAIALSSSVESARVNDATQNSAPATPPETDTEDVALAMAISASFQSHIGANATQSSAPAETATTVEDVELAMAISASMVNHSTQNAFAATTSEDTELTMVLNSSIESAEDVELRKALHASIQSSLEHRRAAPKFSTVFMRRRNGIAATPSAPPIPSMCIICCDAPIEGVCSPCGHMAACMCCLAKIEAEKRECPVCRGRMDKVIKVFGVG